MASCVRCGREAGTGRFCVQCGLPLGGVSTTDTAERPRVPGRHSADEPPRQPPPPLDPAPSNARYPLYADQVPPPQGSLPAGGGLTSLGGMGRAAAPIAPVAPVAPPAPDREVRPSVWIAGGAVLVIALVIGLWTWLGSDPGDGVDTAADSSTAGTGPAPGSSSEGSESPSEGAETSAPPADPGDAGGDVLAGMSTDVPAVAPPGQDVQGNPIDYAPANMFDGDPQTAWRMAGSGEGRDIVIRLGRPGIVTEVGLINGYAKVDRDSAGTPVTWYPRNRRILRVEWRFDDGTTITQRLAERPGLQTVEVPEVTTSTLVLHLDRVSPPKPGRLGRNYTAISDLLVDGTPAP